MNNIEYEFFIEFIKIYKNKIERKGYEYTFCSGYSCSECILGSLCSNIHSSNYNPRITQDMYNRAKREYPELFL